MGKKKFKNIRNQFYWIPRLNIYITKSIKKKCVLQITNITIN